MQVKVSKDSVIITDSDYMIHKGEYRANGVEYEFSSEYEGLTCKAIFNDGTNTVEVPITTGEGTEITLDDTYAAPMRTTLKGNIEQTTYTGKNLSYFNRISANGITFEGNDIDIVNPTNYLYVDVWNLKNNSSLSGKTYTVYSLVNGTTGEKALEFNIGKTGNSYAYQHKLSANTTSTNNLKVATVTLGADEVFTYASLYVNGSTTANLNIKVMIVEGSYTAQTIGDYEPYVGGSPSPSPDYPQPVKVVTGNNTIKVEGKNLYDKDSESIDIVINSSGIVITNSAFNTSDYISIKGNSSYNLSWESSSLYFQAFISYYDSNKTFIQRENITTSNTYTKAFTTLENAKYIRISYSKEVNETPTPRTNIQLELGSSASEYTPYVTPQEYPLNLGDIELCKIGAYQDYIYKENNKWYKHSEIGKVVLNGSENCDNTYGTNLFTLNSYLNSKPFVVGYGLSNYYKYNSIQSGINAGTVNGEFALQQTQGHYSIHIKNTNCSTPADFKTWLGTHNTNIYYPLATPTYEIITNETLINQLEELKKAKSVDDKTFIYQINEQLPFILDVSALSKN